MLTGWKQKLLAQCAQWHEGLLRQEKELVCSWRGYAPRAARPQTCHRNIAKCLHKVPQTTGGQVQMQVRWKRHARQDKVLRVPKDTIGQVAVKHSQRAWNQINGLDANSQLLLSTCRSNSHTICDDCLMLAVLCSPAIARMRLDLPAPLGPVINTDMPGSRRIVSPCGTAQSSSPARLQCCCATCLQHRESSAGRACTQGSVIFVKWAGEEVQWGDLSWRVLHTAEVTGS